MRMDWGPEKVPSKVGLEGVPGVAFGWWRRGEKEGEASAWSVVGGSGGWWNSSRGVVPGGSQHGGPHPPAPSSLSYRWATRNHTIWEPF